MLCMTTASYMIEVYYSALHCTADVTQEVASRGMSLVYDMSEASQKEALVGMLVGTLLEGRKYV